ncbi:helix-turn-helix transcriptional regulator [Parvibaculum sp.]|uniref:helix-turn-helix domain-containing protein n=1 Tax=Parvibaculum sp. TaxID=2024848 RepID=UPI001D719275|nr:helix-turn-helix transcriptional regulator [Parvibaculum sp.]MBX3488898.1 helix-turn-helix transcriptional regulator [Parvibaculum sp.]MCW5727220.1 helix-turn-helix transcriptional regulator [Parvibaculum sp.]
MINGTDIAAMRRALGLSQTELGQKLGGLHQGSVSRLERGKTKPRGLVLTALQALMAEADARATREEAA